MVDDPIRFVSLSKFKHNDRSLSDSNEDGKESNEPEYDEYQYQVEEEQEEETGETTVNQVFAKIEVS